MALGNGFSDTASMPLVPFSNRISNGGFIWDGHFHKVPKTLPAENLPIHGNGFIRPWRVMNRADDSITIALSQNSFGPFTYSAKQIFELAENSLTHRISVRNEGPTALPFGVGFHPWFPRNNQTRIRFQAAEYWEHDAQWCSTLLRPIEPQSPYDYAAPRPMPDDLINTAFHDWRGPCEISQGLGNVAVRITASKNLSTAMLFSPEKDANYLCFEPVSHPVDAFNMDGLPGLKTLEPNKVLSAHITLSW